MAKNYVGGSKWVYDLSNVIIYMHICYFYFLNSPFLFVYGDDRVIRYTGADVDTGDAQDAQATE